LEPLSSIDQLKSLTFKQSSDWMSGTLEVATQKTGSHGGHRGIGMTKVIVEALNLVDVSSLTFTFLEATRLTSQQN